jgi:hypothetical protein
VEKFYAYCKSCNKLTDHADYYCLTCKTLFDKVAALNWIKEQKAKEKAQKPKQETEVKEPKKPQENVVSKPKPKSRPVAKAKPKAKSTAKAKTKPKSKPKEKASSTLKSFTKSTVGAAKRVNNTRKNIEKVASKIWGY